MTRNAHTYICGLRSGDRVALRKPLRIHDDSGAPTRKVYLAGELWTVLPASEEPGIVWFRKPDGDRHTWDDDAAQIDEWFTRLGPTA